MTAFDGYELFFFFLHLFMRRKGNQKETKKSYNASLLEARLKREHSNFRSCCRERINEFCDSTHDRLFVRGKMYVVVISTWCLENKFYAHVELYRL